MSKGNTYRFSGGEKWVVITTKELKTSEALGIDEEIVAYALDKNESAHMDYDAQKKTRTFIYSALYQEERQTFTTLPVTFILQEEHLVTILRPETAYLRETFETYLKEATAPVSVYWFIFACLEAMSLAFYPALEQMDKVKDQLIARLRKKTTKEALFGLSDIEVSLLYLASASKQNSLLLERIRESHFYKGLTVLEQEQCGDALVEASQLVAMTELSLKILESLSETYNNILNNNLNFNLTTLNVIDILLAVLAVLTGFFGMNVPLPFTNDQTAWLWIILVALGLWVILAQVLKWAIRR